MDLQKHWIKITFAILLLFFIFYALISHINKAGRYANLGYRYLRAGNYERAQEFYEKSYSLGNTDSNFRKAYVKAL